MVNLSIVAITQCIYSLVLKSGHHKKNKIPDIYLGLLSKHRLYSSQLENYNRSKLY